MPDLANNENFLSMIEHVINTENKVQVNTTDIYHYYKQDHYNYSFDNRHISLLQAGSLQLFICFPQFLCLPLSV